MTAPTPRPKPTPTEVRIAERYVSVLDFASRVAQAIDGGDWHYLWDKSHQLEAAVGRLRETAEKLLEEIDSGQLRRPPRGDVVRALVVRHGRHYRAGRLLHQPEGGERA